MAQALGVRLLDANGQDLPRGGGRPTGACDHRHQRARPPAG
jgi:glycerate kinase